MEIFFLSFEMEWIMEGGEGYGVFSHRQEGEKNKEGHCDSTTTKKGNISIEKERPLFVDNNDYHLPMMKKARRRRKTKPKNLAVMGRDVCVYYFVYMAAVDVFFLISFDSKKIYYTTIALKMCFSFSSVGVRI
jgi:hypothetical protein